MKSREKTAKAYSLSPSNVARYLRIAQLIKPLLDRVDSGEIAIRPAVALSYLASDEQTLLESLLEKMPFKIDLKKAEALRELSKDKMLANKTIFQIMSGELTNKARKNKPPLTIKYRIYSKFFNESTRPKEMEVIIKRLSQNIF